jgi:hypothetical protein
MKNTGQRQSTGKGERHSEGVTARGVSIASGGGGGGTGGARTRRVEHVLEDHGLIRLPSTNGFCGNGESSPLCSRSDQLFKWCAKTEPAGVRC